MIYERPRVISVSHDLPIEMKSLTRMWNVAVSNLGWVFFIRANRDFVSANCTLSPVTSDYVLR